MKTKNLVKFLIIIALIAAFAYLSLFGATIGNYQIVPVKDLIKLGLDLSGGVYVQLQAVADPNDPITDEKIQRAITTIRTRIDSLGVTEPVITSEGSDRIRVELPDIQDPQRALELIGQTAQLMFKDEEGNVVLTGDDVKSAEVVYYPSDNRLLGEVPVVSLKLNAEGTKKFAVATEKNIGKTIGIYLDDVAKSTPVVQSIISNGEAVIGQTGNIDPANYNKEKELQEARDLATVIMAGALPVTLETLQVSSVGPQLGANSFETSLKAGIIGVILVLLFMAIVYRLPGVVTDITLVLYVCIVLTALALLQATLTLPGIAGFILTIGMAVDANVIIFERIKEEVKNGKSLRAAVDAGFRRAFITIFDSNITTLIAAVILFYVGSGPIKGFAVTLGIGILASMFTAVVVTRYLIKLLVDGDIIKNKKIFGV